MTLRYIHSMLLFGFMMVKVSFCQQNTFTDILFDGCGDLSVHSLDTLSDISEVLDQLFLYGYAYPVVDSVGITDEGEVRYRIDCGPQFRFVEIHWVGSLVDSLQIVQRKHHVYPWEEVMLPRTEILNHLANIGYPYSRVYTHPQMLKRDTLVMEHTLDTVRRVFVQDVELKGEFEMNPLLFSRMTGISGNQVFSMDRIEQSREVIRQWEFAELENIEYDFNPYGVNLIYNLRNRQPSRFDLLVGLVPSNLPDRQYEITGNGYLDVRNQLKMGERMFVKFDKYGHSSQAFDVQVDFPYLPFIRSGILAAGQIDRRDSTVLDVHGKLGVQYNWKPALRYAFFLQRDQSRLTGISTSRLKRQGVLPEDLDFNYSAAGLSMTLQKLDHLLNPRKGSMLRTSLTVGLRKLVWNAQILAIELPPDQTTFRAQYQALPERTVKVGVDVNWEKFIPVGMYSAFRFRTMGGGIWSSESLFQNELRRIGGFQNLRGFPENSFHADGYSISTAEYRFLFGEESNIYAFADAGFLHHPGSEPNWNFPYSVGIGLNLGTRAGIFGISYAVGGQRNDPLSLDQSRVNFGLMVNY